ncbi:hypothetical protein [Desulfonema ishimotonii]|uniref:hypothetical protein n=1 Tax=Desulfonema ishimotonii TaxID=45657 RepID=UPI001E3F02CB|nr:hypothetical protein [Desulfonema ishimotonii]
MIIRVTGKDQIDRVRVVTGARLSLLDTTGTLTQKYQARLVSGKATAELITPYDTENLAPLVYPGAEQHIRSASPVSYPTDKFLIPIRILFEKLTPLLGSKFSCTGSDQERLRGAELHRRVCQQIGYTNYQDDGRFPDIRHQLLEVKLQTSPTIDLGLVCPNSQNILDVPEIQGRQIRHCDVRYAVFCGQSDGGQIMLTHLYVTTGEAFISRFPQFQGKVLNKKRQLRLPADFFGR